MQKSKLTSNLFLAIQNTYEAIELALFDLHTCIDTQHEPKVSGSKNFILLIQQLLERNHVSLKEVTYIAVNQGPGPFTTLRVVLATVNGLSFATHIPLIGIDGLHALLEEYKDNSYPNTIALLNAFNKDVYFALQLGDTPVTTGYKNITTFLENLYADYPTTPIRFIGNGAKLYRQEIIAMFGMHAILPEPMPDTCSVQQIGIMGLAQWQQGNTGAAQLLPLHLKLHPAQQRHNK